MSVSDTDTTPTHIVTLSYVILSKYYRCRYVRVSIRVREIKKTKKILILKTKHPRFFKNIHKKKSPRSHYFFWDPSI